MNQGEDQHVSSKDQSEEKNFLSNPNSYETKVVHSGIPAGHFTHGALVPEISMSTNYKLAQMKAPDLDAIRNHEIYVYSRAGNSSQTTLENAIAELESAEYALVFSSGVSAVQAVTMLLDAGDHVIASHHLYGGSMLLWRHHAERFGIIFTYVDTRDLENVRRAIRPKTQMVYVETTSNPTMQVTDLRSLSRLAREHDNIITVCDNTFMTPYFQRPLELGVDLSLHSVTKYLNGHHDVLMGAVATNCEQLRNKLHSVQMHVGMVPSPPDCYMAYRGLKTLHVRMKQHMSSAIDVAQFLEGHPLVERVLYPGLPSHPQYDLTRKQTSGCSGMVSFYIRGDEQLTTRFFQNLKLFTIAGSLGGYESLAVGPTFSTHAMYSKEELEELGITKEMVRLSVGLEDPKDLCADLAQALEYASC